MAQLGDTYTPDTNKYNQTVDKYRSIVGDNPEAIRQAVADEMIKTDQPLQENITTQNEAIKQLYQADVDAANMFKQAGQGQQQVQQFLNTTNQMGQQLAADPTKTWNTQDIINAAPQNVVLSPFVASSAATGQSQAGQGTFDLASQQRGSRERAIGTEAENVAKLAGYQIEQERIQRELEEQRKKEEEAKKLAEFERQKEYVALVGGEITDPTTGVVYKYPTPEEKAAIEARNKQTVEGTNKTSDVWNEMIKGAKTEYDIWKNIDLNQDALRASGVDVDQLWAWHKNLADRVGTGGSVAGAGAEQKTNYLGQLAAAGKIDMVKDVPAAEKEAAAKYLIENGAINEKPGEKQLSEQEQSTVNLIDEILGRETKSITGSMRMGLISPFSPDSRYTAAKVKQLSGLLQLAEAGQLKGQGQISEGERQILRDAIASLALTERGGSTLSDEDFRIELNKIKSVLGGTYKPSQSTEGTEFNVDEFLAQEGY